MTEQLPPLITFYQGWENYQQSLVEITESLSSEQLALPVAPHYRRSIGELLGHMIGARVFWFHVWMGEGDPALAHLDEDEQSESDAASLVATLEATWSMIAGALARWTSADLGEIFPTPASLSEEERQFFPPRTRQWIIWHTLEHEIYHGGELSLVLGSYGLEGIYGNI
jgi:uncharacterized damage-inducible protein DinB